MLDWRSNGYLNNIYCMMTSALSYTLTQYWDTQISPMFSFKPASVCWQTAQSDMTSLWYIYLKHDVRMVGGERTLYDMEVMLIRWKTGNWMSHILWTPYVKLPKERPFSFDQFQISYFTTEEKVFFNSMILACRLFINGEYYLCFYKCLKYSRLWRNE